MTRRGRLWVAGLVLGMVGCGGSQSPSVAWGPAQLIGGGTEADQFVTPDGGRIGGFVPRLAGNAAGGRLVVWDRRTPSDSTIWANSFRQDSGWASAQMIGDGANPVVAIDPAGNGLAVWEQPDAHPSVWADRFTAASGWGTPQRVPATPAGTLDAALALGPQGDGLLSYTTLGDGVWSQGFSANGGWSTPQRIATDVTGDGLSSPQVVLDPNGNAAVVWIQYQSTSGHGYTWLRGTHFVAGAGWQPATDVGVILGDWFESPTRLGGDDNGHALIAWSAIQAVPLGVGYNRLTVSGGWQTGQQIAASPFLAGQLAVAPTGTATLILAGTSDSSEANILAAMPYTPGSGWGTPARLQLGSGESVSSSDAVLRASGAGYAVWSQSAVTHRGVVWAATLSSGSTWGTPLRIRPNAPDQPQCALDLGIGGAYSPSVVTDASGSAAAVWGEFDCSRLSIWASRFAGTPASE